jgi:transcriptional regulator
MYIPSHFKETDDAEIIRFLEHHRFGMLVANGDSVPMTGHFPYILRTTEDETFVELHFARKNELASLKSGDRVKFVVSGAHGYISSSVYVHTDVPTYNYQAVHVTGEIDYMTGPELLVHLKLTVALHESSRKDPVDFDAWPMELIAKYFEDIVGIKIRVEKTEAAYKLSQNRKSEDFHKIIDDLEKRDEAARELASEMKRTRE